MAQSPPTQVAPTRSLPAHLLLLPLLTALVAVPLLPSNYRQHAYALTRFLAIVISTAGLRRAYAQRHGVFDGYGALALWASMLLAALGVSLLAVCVGGSTLAREGTAAALALVGGAMFRLPTVEPPVATDEEAAVGTPEMDEAIREMLYCSDEKQIVPLLAAPAASQAGTSKSATIEVAAA